MEEQNKYTFENKEYRDTYRHTVSHILAQAVKRLYPEVKLAIGPAIENGFYYDFDAPFSFTQEHLDALEGEKRTMIFYEAPHKLCATLRDLAAAFGEERRLSLSRELTKLHEQTLRMTLGEAMRYFDENAPRGEFVLIVEGAPDEPETEQSEEERLAAAAEAVRRRIEQGQTQKDAVKAVSAEVGVKKNALYRYVLENE